MGVLVMHLFLELCNSNWR